MSALLSVKLSDFTQLLFVKHSFILNALCLSFLSLSHHHEKQIQIDPDRLQDQEASMIQLRGSFFTEAVFFWDIDWAPKVTVFEMSECKGGLRSKHRIVFLINFMSSPLNQ